MLNSQNDYNNERHKELLIRAQDLENQGRDFSIENRQEYFELFEYSIAVEEQIYWKYREEFLLIMKNLLDNNFTFDEFKTDFSILDRKVFNEVQLSTNNLEYIEKFEPSRRPDRFGSYMNSIYRQFEDVQDEYCTEQEVTDFVKKAYLKFQIFEE